MVKIKKVEITTHIKPISLPESKLCHDRKRKKPIKRKERKSKKKAERKGQQRRNRKIQKNEKKTGKRKRIQRNRRRRVRKRRRKTKNGTFRQGAKKDKRMNMGNDYSFKVSRFKFIVKHKRIFWERGVGETI